MKVDDAKAWQAFCAVAKTRSFSKAAAALKVGTPQLSKRIGRLEEQLGVRLFARSTRVVALTDEGKSLLPRVLALLEDWSSLEEAFECDTSLKGTIRVTAVPFIAQRLLIPAFAEFKRRHPDVRIELDLSEGLVNLVESNFDLALRIHANPPDSSLVYRKLGENELVFVASPRYLKSAKQPLKKPSDLRDHSMLLLGIHEKCRLRDGSSSLGELARLRPFTSPNGWYLTELALSDFGVLVRSSLDVREHLKAGRLVQVLKNHAIEPFGNIYAVVPTRRFLAPRVRALLDIVIKRSPLG